MVPEFFLLLFLAIAFGVAYYFVRIDRQSEFSVQSQVVIAIAAIIQAGFFLYLKSQSWLLLGVVIEAAILGCIDLIETPKGTRGRIDLTSEMPTTWERFQFAFLALIFRDIGGNFIFRGALVVFACWLRSFLV